MAYMPMMPGGGADQVATPMPGGNPTMGQPPMGGGGLDLASLLGAGGGAPPMGGGSDPMQQGLGQFDQLAQLITDIARMFPGTEQMASQMMEVLDQWRQQALVMTTPQPSTMPGADMMM